MKSLATTWHLIPAQEWNQGHIDIGMVYLVKRPATRRVKLARAGTVQYLAGDQKAAEFGQGLSSDRRAAREWFLAKNEDDVLKKSSASCSLSSSWEWPPEGTKGEDAAAGQPAIKGVPHILTYGPRDRLISTQFAAKLKGVLDFLGALFGKMDIEGAKAHKERIKDMREHILSDEFKNAMKRRWSLSFEKAQMITAMKKLEMITATKKPKAGEELKFIVVTEIACVSYALSEKRSEMGGGGGGGATGVAAGFEGGLKNSKTDESAGTTLLLGFRAAEFSVVYPEDTSKACIIHSWEAGVPLNSVIKAAAASSSTGQVQQSISKLMVAIYDSSDEDLKDLFVRDSEEAEDEQQQQPQQQQQQGAQQDEQQEASVGDKRHAAPAEDQPAAKAAKS